MADDKYTRSISSGSDRRARVSEQRNAQENELHGADHTVAVYNPGGGTTALQRMNGRAPFDAAEIERQGLLLREVSMRKERKKIRRKYFLMIFVTFVFAIAVIYRYSIVIEINEKIMKEKTTLASLENENSLLQKQIGVEMDLEKIRLLAESKLDMQKPDRDQIVYIKVPKKDHALVAVPAKQNDPDGINPFAYLFEQAQLIQKRLFAD